MLSGGEILSGLTGVWRIILRDGEASRFFDLSLDGFYRSFWVVVLALPVIFFNTTSFWLLMQEMHLSADENFTSFAIVEIGSTLLKWAVYLVAMNSVARQLRLSQRYTAYVVTYNWGMLFIAMVLAAPLLLYSLGFSSGPGTGALTLPVFGLLGWYRWLIAREVLGAAVSASAAILVFDIMLGLVLEQGLAVIVYAIGGGHV